MTSAIFISLGCGFLAMLLFVCTETAARHCPYWPIRLGLYVAATLTVSFLFFMFIKDLAKQP
jgi:hypothetical protein